MIHPENWTDFVIQAEDLLHEFQITLSIIQSLWLTTVINQFAICWHLSIYYIDKFKRNVGVLVSSYCCSSYGAVNPFNYFGTFSSYFIGDPMFQELTGTKPPIKENTWWDSWLQLHMQQRMAQSIINGRRGLWSCEGSMPQYRGMPGPGSRSGWVGEQGEGG